MLYNRFPSAFDKHFVFISCVSVLCFRNETQNHAKITFIEQAK